MFLTAAVTSKAAAPANAPPRTELVLGRKWSIENHTGNRNLIIDQTDAKQSVYIFNCSNCTVQVCLTLDADAVIAARFCVCGKAVEAVSCIGQGHHSNFPTTHSDQMISRQHYHSIKPDSHIDQGATRPQKRNCCQGYFQSGKFQPENANSTLRRSCDKATASDRAILKARMKLEIGVHVC